MLYNNVGGWGEEKPEKKGNFKLCSDWVGKKGECCRLLYPAGPWWRGQGGKGGRRCWEGVGG